MHIGYLEDDTPEVVIGGDARLSQPMTTVAGGSGLNTATHLSSLINHFGIDDDTSSFQVNLQTVINENDQYGKLLASHARQHGFNLLNRRVSDFPSCFFGTEESTIQSGGKSTGHCAVIVAKGERSFMTHLGCIEDFRGSHIIDESINGYDLQHLHVSGYYNIQGFWDGELKSKLAEFKQRNKHVTVSLVPQHDATEKWDGGLLDVLEHVDFLILSEVEAKCISKYHHDSADQSFFEYAAGFFRDACPNTHVIITLGSDGCVCVHNGAMIKIATIKKQPVDPTGAGDAFAAGFVFGLLKCMGQEKDEGGTLKMSMIWGCATGTNCVMIRGASIPPEKLSIEQTLNDVTTINKEVKGVSSKCRFSCFK